MISQCQNCNQNSHLSKDCPYMNTPCTIPGCPGQRMILVSKTEKNTGRKFLKCQQSQCNGFHWLDHAILASHGYEVPVQGCFICNDPAHWLKDCPWNSLVCGKNGCTAKKWLRISSNPNSAGKRYLKCYTCKAFEWVKEEDDDDLQQPIKKPSPVQKLIPTQQSVLVQQSVPVQHLIPVQQLVPVQQPVPPVLV